MEGLGIFHYSVRRKPADSVFILGFMLNF